MRITPEEHLSVDCAGASGDFAPRDLERRAGIRATGSEFPVVVGGDDIDAACGQLVGRVRSKQKRHFREVPIRVESKRATPV